MELPVDQPRKVQCVRAAEDHAVNRRPNRILKNVKPGWQVPQQQATTVLDIQEGKIIFDKAEIIGKQADLHLDQE
jgi:hypothetical protein